MREQSVGIHPSILKHPPQDKIDFHVLPGRGGASLFIIHFWRFYIWLVIFTTWAWFVVRRIWFRCAWLFIVALHVSVLCFECFTNILIYTCFFSSHISLHNTNSRWKNGLFVSIWQIDNRMSLGLQVPCSPFTNIYQLSAFHSIAMFLLILFSCVRFWLFSLSANM